MSSSEQKEGTIKFFNVSRNCYEKVQMHFCMTMSTFIHKCTNNYNKLIYICFSSVKQMKFPFFSHKKRPKSKKIKKKKVCVSTTTCPVIQSSSAKAANVQFFSDNDKIMKRSYERTFCPLCKRKFGPKRGNPVLRKKNTMIHNSRQFYQNAEEKNKAISNTGIQNEVTEKSTLNAVALESNKFRRVDSADEREKHLKELEDIQNKVDNMDVNKLGAITDTHKGNDKERDREREKEKEETR